MLDKRFENRELVSISIVRTIFRRPKFVARDLSRREQITGACARLENATAWATLEIKESRFKIEMARPRDIRAPSKSCRALGANRYLSFY